MPSSMFVCSVCRLCQRITLRCSYVIGAIFNIMNNSKVKEILPFAQTPGAKILQYQIGIGGMINRPEDRRLLTRIDTLEFSKWQLQTIDQLPSWFDVFDVPWTCFACRGMAGSHAFFCHTSRSYKKRENERINGENWNQSVTRFMCRDILMNLVRDETKYTRKTGLHHTIYNEQLSRHDSLPVVPKQSPELLQIQCPDSVIVHEQTPHNLGGPVLIGKKRERDPVAMNKNDALLPKNRGKNVVSKSNKDSQPQTSVTPPFIVKFKLGRNMEKKGY